MSDEKQPPRPVPDPRDGVDLDALLEALRADPDAPVQVQHVTSAEPTGFERVASALMEKALVDGSLINQGWKRFVIMLIAEQLRVSWNARGAADIVKVESELSTMMGSTAAGPYVKNLDRALRTLDR
jgi:hypothetical protein